MEQGAGMPIRITGTGAYLPETVLTNAELQARTGLRDEWIVARSGVRERRVAGKEEAASDLGLVAARRALEEAGCPPEALDLLVVATTTPDTLCPSTACWIQARLGAARALPFDVSASSAGFLVALSIAQQYLRSGAARRALVVAAEVVTRYVDWGDRQNCFLWGDGAAAAVLEAGPGPGAALLGLTLHADGRQADRLLLPGGGSRVAPITARTVETGAHAIRMHGSQVYRSSIRRLVEACGEVLGEAGLPLEAVALLVPHQANLRIIEAVAARLPLPMDRVVVTIDYTGNCSGASLPLAFDAARRQGRLRAGDVVLLAAFGGGLIWGAGLVRM